MQGLNAKIESEEIERFLKNLDFKSPTKSEIFHDEEFGRVSIYQVIDKNFDEDTSMISIFMHGSQIQELEKLLGLKFQGSHVSGFDHRKISNVIRVELISYFGSEDRS